MGNAPSDESLDVRLSDLSTFLVVLHSGSLRGAARRLGVTPSQVSKAVARLEDHLNVRLLDRHGGGAEISAEGRRLGPRIDSALRGVRMLRNHPSDSPQEEIILAALSFLNELVVPGIVASLPEYQFRSLELPPGIEVALSGQHLFDVALTTEEQGWPATWSRKTVGLLRRALFARPSFASRLGTPPLQPEALRAHPFIGPAYSYHGQLMTGDDRCPLGRDRRIQHETQTARLALAIAAEADLLVFAPVIAARSDVREGRLVELKVVGWEVASPLHLICHGERVRARVQKTILAVAQRALEGTGDSTRATAV